MSLIYLLLGEGREKSDQWASVISGGIAVVAFVWTVMRWLWQRPELGVAWDTAERIAALSALAGAQLEVWTQEQSARQVHDPWPLPVRWLVSTQAEAVMASWGAVRGAPGGTPLALAGSYDDVADVFMREGAPQRLVVLGEPGAGKSMLVLHLTLQMLRRRQEDAPVPVLLPIAGWDPAEPLDDWVAARLVLDHRSLSRFVRTERGERRTVARQLVAEGRIVPVLDGFDEIHPVRQGSALAGIAAAAGVGRRFVLTSRTKPYEIAVEGAAPLARTAVVELQPLLPAEAARYLADGAEQPTTRWDPVVADLTTGVGTPLIQAMSTPLTVWLARVVYRHRGSTPGELVTAPWAAGRDGITRHLLDEVITAAYTAPVGRRPAHGVEHARRARIWLMTLARHLHNHRMYDLAWWQIVELPPGPVLQVFALLGLWGAAMVAVTSAAALIVGGVPDALADGPFSATVVGLILGLAIGLVRRTVSDHQRPRRLTLGHVPAWMLVTGLPVGACVVAVAGPEPALLAGTAAGITAALIAGAAGTRGHDDQRTANPAVLLSEDRAAGLVAGTAGGLAVAVALGWFISSGPGVLDTVRNGLVYGLPAGLLVAGLVISATAWGQFCLTRIVLWARGATPLRLLSFLDDAYDRGILRRVGSVHQFRHHLLQDHLARQPRPVGDP
ncbi:hypothetical protein [Dactylosporangium sp. NPDC006015]|uniref:hypothetical protein n=1 Tax=Dactylosporangium sp. NPDC006015 TaxID=3154576 RepID=UPI0033B19CCE